MEFSSSFVVLMMVPARHFLEANAQTRLKFIDDSILDLLIEERVEAIQDCIQDTLCTYYTKSDVFS